MRRSLLLLGLVLVVLANLWSCSKKSSPPPVAPTPDPACSLSATTLAFGTVTVGSTADQSFTITNTGGGTLSGTVSESSPEFAMSGTASYSLDAGEAATFTLHFSPTSAGAKVCTLATGSSLCGTVLASGTGQSATPVCYVQTTSLDFGTLDYGVTANRQIAIQNAGGGTLTGSLSGAAVDFRFLDPPTFSLGAGEWANIALQFSPSRSGVQVCTLTVDPPGCAPIICRGEGNLPVYNHCSVAVTSGVVEFGDVSIGFTAERTFTIKNFSDTYIARGSLLDQCPEFDAVATYNIFPGGTSTIAARFVPTRPGPQECAIPISCWMDGSGTNPGVQSYVICRGTGVGGSPQCQLSTTTLDFDQVVVGQTKDLPILITNVGTGTLSGTAGPSHCTEFSFVGSSSYSVGAGQSATLTVRYTPRQVGHTTTCSLVPTGLDCPAITLVGEAVGPPSCAIEPTALDFGSVTVGQSRDLSFDLRNAGGGTLCGNVTESCADFSVIQNASYCVTRPGFVSVTMRFAPTSTGFKQCIISPGSGCPAVTVSGTGN
jgi:hypothetical protein